MISNLVRRSQDIADSSLKIYLIHMLMEKTVLKSVSWGGLKNYMNDLPAASSRSFVRHQQNLMGKQGRVWTDSWCWSCKRHVHECVPSLVTLLEFLLVLVLVYERGCVWNTIQSHERSTNLGDVTGTLRCASNPAHSVCEMWTHAQDIPYWQRWNILS